jgi:hypothetical protein
LLVKVVDVVVVEAFKFALCIASCLLEWVWYADWVEMINLIEVGIFFLAKCFYFWFMLSVIKKS